MSRSIAIIGSGIAGLAAAHGCRSAGMQVSLFEAQPDIGMAAHTLRVDGGIVDVPLRVMNPQIWRSTLALARRVKVGTFAVEVNSSCSDAEGRTWFRSARMLLTGWPIAGGLRFLTPDAMRLGVGMLWLGRLTRRLQASRSRQTLAEVLSGETVDPLFWRGLILPILLTICTCEEEHLLAWPAAELLATLHAILHTGQSLRLHGGTHALASALAQGVELYVGSQVREVRQHRSGIDVHNARGDGGRFDAVIVATQANQLDFLDAKRFGAERELLKGIPYARGELIVHRDERFMPRRRQDWAPLNFQVDATAKTPMFTVWVNAVEPTLKDKQPVFQTWNPCFQPDPELTLARQPLQRAVVNRGTRDILKALNTWHRQPGRRLFYCGSWAYKGVPLLESAVRSAQAVVRLLRA